MAGVEFDTVTKVFQDTSGPIVAVEELSLDIPDGEFVVFVGPSGCGKSTTLRMLAGLETITDGEIRLDGTPVNDMSPRDRDIAMVFQSYALYPHKTVRQNMGYGLHLSTDLQDEEIDRRVVEAAEMMGIEDLLDKKPGSLSGGQQQRVATGRAIVREPSVFLFDEPLSNLDAQLRKHMRTELARIHSELGITTIYVTHDQEEAMTMADRIVILDNGQLQQVGTPKDVYYRPANTFVADFIGSPSMNFFDVELEATESGGRLVGTGVDCEVSNRIVEQASPGEYILSLRPENLVVDNEAPASESFEATVDVVEVIGSDNFLYLDVAGQECRVRAPVEVEPSEGETVRLTFEESDIHLFDRDTEDAVLHGYTRADSSPRTIQQEA
jgi:multiple sugar transport system ATP-binding protein